MARNKLKDGTMTQAGLSTLSSAQRLPGSLEFVTIGELNATGELFARARLLGVRIDTRDVVGDDAVTRLAALTGLTFVFRYGVVVTFGSGAEPTEGLDAALGRHVVDRTKVQEIESTSLAIRPVGGDRIGPDGQILLVDSSHERLLLVATVLARSVVLSRDEILVSEAFERISPLVNDLQENGRARLPIRRVMKLVGNVLAARHRVMGMVQVDERPDILWDHPELDHLYVRLEAEYELKERAGVLERKFVALGDSAEVLLDIVQDIRAFHLEVAIIALIALEIVLTLSDMAMR
jgi:uncharacterized Rmd1/YagE family protein